MENKQEPSLQSYISTSICQEVPADGNPFVAEKRFVHGYDLQQLAAKKDWIDCLYLLFKGDFPNDIDKKLFNMIFVGLIHIGTRHPATRASMVAGISKTNTEHLLPIGLIALGGNKGGAIEVSESYDFIEKSWKLSPELVAKESLKNCVNTKLVAGFGNAYGDKDPIIEELASQILSLKPNSSIFKWCSTFVNKISEQHFGWMVPGLFAAVLLELGIGKREAIGLFQLACAPGIFAQAVEQTHKPISNSPLLDDECYVLKK